MLYPLARHLLFQLDPERAHQVSLLALNQAAHCGLSLCQNSPQVLPRTVMGLSFPNPVGIAAGLDKNADYLSGLGSLGPGFIEVGTVTPRPQPGNPKPRVFRLPEVEGLINRLGFNNLGVQHLLEQVQVRTWKGILGINLGKNFDTPLELAHEDYVLGLRQVYAHADYVTINISSPNTQNLRQLQDAPVLGALLATLKQTQRELSDRQGRYVPIVIKIAPDLSHEALLDIAHLLLQHQMDGVIATNTTVSRDRVLGLALAQETGGLSGAPLHTRSLQVVTTLAQILQGALPIIGVGGINSPARAQAMLQAGASLVQIYTGIVYKGPGLIRDIVRALA